MGLYLHNFSNSCCVIIPWHIHFKVYMDETEVLKTIALLKKAAIFSPLSEEELRIIAENSEFLQFKQNQTIFHQDDPGTELYLVDFGEVILSRAEPYEKEIDIARFIQGEIFGEMDLLQETKRNVRAWVEEKATLLRFPKRGREFREVLKEYPEIAARLLHKFLVVVAGRIRSTNAMIKENSPVVQELKKQVYTDKLTGLWNKTFLEENAGSYTRDPSKTAALLSMKPDNFKLINDTYGHEAGDRAIQIMAAKLQTMVGKDLLLVRYMGNELMILLPKATRDDALYFAEDLRGEMTDLDFSEVTGGEEFHLSVSIGIALYPDHASGPLEFIERAHELPLIGRGRGGNKVLFPEDKEEKSGVKTG